MAPVPVVQRTPVVRSVKENKVINQLSTELVDYICAGPVIQLTGYDHSRVEANQDTWASLGQQFATYLNFDMKDINEQQKSRIYHYYVPVYLWLIDQLNAHKLRHTGPDRAPALMLGITAPQGCGKSTLVEALTHILSQNGCNAAHASVDDFYLTYDAQCELGTKHEGNALLQYRGNAGSHEMELGVEQLMGMRDLKEGEVMKKVVYDKSKQGGRGDRADVDKWPTVTGPLEVVLMEGWMFGFTPIDDESIEEIDPQLFDVNSYLSMYKSTWDSLMDAWLVIKVQNPKWVFDWRLQAEHRMKKSGKAGMTDQQVEDFVSRFMPAYKAYLPGLYANGPSTVVDGRSLVIEVDSNRKPIAKQEGSVWEQ